MRWRVELSVAPSGPRHVAATFTNDDPGVMVDVTKSGTGGGGVAAGWLGILPGSEAGGTNLPWQRSFPRNKPVTLFATPASDSVFSGWSGGGCSGTDSCTLDLAMGRSVSAVFTRKPLLTLRISTDTAGKPFDNSQYSIAAGNANSSMACRNDCNSNSPPGCITTCVKGFPPGDQISVITSLPPQWIHVHGLVE